MSFALWVIQKLDESKDLFGSYDYYDKGPDEVMDVNEIFRRFKKIPKEKAIDELKTLLNTTHDLNPSALVSKILGSVDGNPEYDFLFEDKELCAIY